MLESLRSAKSPPARTIELYGHVLGAEHVWLARIYSRPATVAVWPAVTLDQCEEIARTNRKSFDDLVMPLDTARLAKQISYRNSADFIAFARGAPAATRHNP